MTTINFETRIARLNACFGLIDQACDAAENVASQSVLTRLQEQGAVYAAFLTDCSTGRVEWRTKQAMTNLDLIESFCDLIETELKQQEPA